ncbi:MAG: DNA helicase Rep [Thiotrichaceae bacterium]|nr:DNA helicase Rep [Thiotrichaceae bacterium]
MQTLNPQQQEAVEYISSPLLVLAGAGSGKTRVITTKVQWLIRNAGYQPHQITAITFTNKAAKEMKSRVMELLHKEESKGLTVSTFHTLGLKIIRYELKTLGYKSGFSLFDSQDTTTILKELTFSEAQVDDDNTDDLKKPIWQISRWKNDLVSPEQAISTAVNDQELHVAKLYERYTRQLKAYNAVDFDDLIMLPVLLFQQHPDILDKWQNRIRYLLVDEYQDTNNCQYTLVRMLTGVAGGLTIVGDDDQSIYAWRGAKPENIHLLKSDYPRLKVIKLEQNYRSTEHILSAANHLIANNPHLINKKLWSNLGEGEKIRIIPCRTVEHECEQVISQLMKLNFREHAKWKDFAILYRSNHQSILFEKYLRQNHIPYKITGGTSFFERTEIKDILAYIRLITNPDDDAAFLRVINTPRRKIGVSTLEKLGTYARNREVSLLKAATEIGFAQQASAQALQRIEYFVDWIEQLQRIEIDYPPHQLILQIIKDCHYEDWIRNTSKSPKMADNRISNVIELVDWANKLYDDGKGKEDLSDLVAHFTLVDMLERNSDEEETDEITMMTLHSAKGLEFPYVFMIGVEEDILPHQNSLEDNGVEEERRLAYVGITRARQRLFISFAKTRRRFGEKLTCEPSRFLEELPKQHIEWENKVVVSEEERQATASRYIADLQSLLDN